jgi:hypothetical protein
MPYRSQVQGKIKQNFQCNALSSGFAFPGSGWDTDQLLKGDRRDHGPVCYYLAKSIIFSKTVGIYGEND